MRNNVENKRGIRDSSNCNMITMMPPHEVDRLIRTLQDSYANLKSIAANAAASNKKRQKIRAEKLAAQFQYLIGWLQQWQQRHQQYKQSKV